MAITVRGHVVDHSEDHTPRQPSAARFDTLFERFYGEVFGLTYRVLGDRMETEDTLQDVFLKLADAHDLQRKPDPEVAAWLRRVALHAAFNRLRAERRARARLERVETQARADVPPDRGQPAALVERQEERAAVRRALAEVPER